jgi:uncharacterized membrane protein
MFTFYLSYVLHIVGVFMWVGGLFQLVSTMSSHAKEYNNPQFPVLHEYFCRFEKRIVASAVYPGLALTLFGGIWRITQKSGLMKIGWFHGKLLVAVLFICFTYFMLKKMKELHAAVPTDRMPIFGMLNGVAGLLLIAMAIFLSMLP